MKRIWHIVLVLLFVLPLAAQTDELCMEGTLLFREDFGGNSPEDPDVSRASVPGMELPYINSGNSLGSGHYSLRKEGGGITVFNGIGRTTILISVIRREAICWRLTV